MGTPVSAAARATARSPCPSGAHNPMTPIGLMKIGDGSGMPKSSMDKSRCWAPTNMRGTMPQPSKAAAFASCVRSLPLPPATYESTLAGSAACACAAKSSKRIGKRGRSLRRPAT